MSIPTHIHHRALFVRLLQCRLDGLGQLIQLFNPNKCAACKPVKPRKVLNHHDKPEQARVPLDTPATWSSSWTGPQTSLLRWMRLEQCTTSPRWCLIIQDVKPQLRTQKSSAGSYRAHVRAFASYDRVPHHEEHLGCYTVYSEQTGCTGHGQLQLQLRKQ